MIISTWGQAFVWIGSYEIVSSISCPFLVFKVVSEM